jgi:hypothetical protein
METHNQSFNLETTSQRASTEQVDAIWRERNRRHDLLVKDCLKNALDGRTRGWHITLNTKAIIHEHDQFEHEFLLLERQLQHFTNRMNGFCYRRRKDLRLRTLAGIEIGGDRRRLHAHLVMAHDNDTDQSLAQIRRQVVKHWGYEYQFDEAGFINVENIYDMPGIVHYITGECEWMLGMYKQSVLQTF